MQSNVGQEREKKTDKKNVFYNKNISVVDLKRIPKIVDKKKTKQIEKHSDGM